jgi:hypothetical protein
LRGLASQPAECCKPQGQHATNGGLHVYCARLYSAPLPLLPCTNTAGSHCWMSDGTKGFCTLNQVPATPIANAAPSVQTSYPPIDAYAPLSHALPQTHPMQHPCNGTHIQTASRLVCQGHTNGLYYIHGAQQVSRAGELPRKQQPGTSFASVQCNQVLLILSKVVPGCQGATHVAGVTCRLTVGPWLRPHHHVMITG